MNARMILLLFLAVSTSLEAAPRRRGRQAPSSRRNVAPVNSAPVVSDEALDAEDARSQGKAPVKSKTSVTPAPAPTPSATPEESVPAPEPVAEVAPAPTSTSKEVTFVSKRYWMAPRWYVLGRWNSPREIQWPGGVKIALRFASPQCGQGTELGFLERLGKNAGELEVLQTGPWFAIEASPDFSSEDFEAVLPDTPEGRPCRSRIPVAYAWNGEKGQRDPVLFLSSTGNEFFNRTFHVSTPALGKQADLQLEVLLGAWRGQFPNAVGASKGFFLAPTAVTRGEWLVPGLRKALGLQLAIEQNVSNLGSGPDQNVLFSDWMAGVFYQRYFPWFDGIQARLNLRYHQHTAEDNKKSLTLADPGRDASQLMFGLGATSYFQRVWFVGGDLDYSSSMIDFTVRGGRRLTGSLYWVLELGYRRQSIVGYSAESLLKTQTGIRLDL